MPSPLNRLALLCVVGLVLATPPASAHDQSSSNASLTDSVPRTPLPRLAQRLADRQPITVVCLGDSVTGRYYHTGGIRAYPELLVEHLRHRWPDSAVEVRNAGISGHTTLDGLNRLERDVLVHQPQVVTIQFGLNDMVRVPPDTFRANLATLVSRCREAGAEVVLCTPNGILDPRLRGGEGRSVETLEQFANITRALAADLRTPLCDLLAGYQAVARHDPRQFRLLMSDQIHPNLDGHRLNAAELAHVLCGPSWPGDPFEPGVLPARTALTKTRSRAAQGEPIRLLAMATSGEPVAAALRAHVGPSAVQITPWDVAGQTLSQIEAAAARVRKEGPYDLVVIALPASEVPLDSANEAEMWSVNWILNNALAFGHRDWDVLVAAPSLEPTPFSSESSSREEFLRRLARAQDLPLVTRPARLANAPAAEVWADWFRRHWTE